MIAYLEISAFTGTPGLGSRAGVVLEAGSLTEVQMQALAAFIDAPETVFVHSTRGALRVRYFTPTQEVEFCGHATVALGLGLAQAGFWRTGSLEVHTLAGSVPLRLELGAAGEAKIWMQQPPLSCREVPLHWRSALAEALGISDRLIHRGLPLISASTGLWSVCVPLLDSLVLDGLEPDFAAISRLCEELGVGSVYAYAPMGVNRFAARAFAPLLGIHEDPVTGSVAGALLGVLAQEGRLPVQRGRATGMIYQGHALGTPGEVEVEVEVQGGRVTAVHVGGLAVLDREGYWSID